MFNSLVTESEIRHGIISEASPEEHCLWISRNLRDLEDHLQDDNAQSFIDINSTSREIDFEAQDLLRVRSEARLFSCLICCRSEVLLKNYQSPIHFC